MKKLLSILPIILMSSATIAATCNTDFDEMQLEIIQHRSVPTIDGHHFLKIDNLSGDQSSCSVDAYQMYKNTGHLRYLCKGIWIAGNWRNTLKCNTPAPVEMQ